MNIGVLALQGGYQAHINCLNKLGVFCSLVRDRAALKASDALITPGGESSVLIKLLKQHQLWASLIDYDKPILGICAGIHWGALGAAAGHVLANYVLFLPAAYIAFKDTPVTVGLFLSAIFPAAICRRER